MAPDEVFCGARPAEEIRGRARLSQSLLKGRRSTDSDLYESGSHLEHATHLLLFRLYRFHAL